MMGGYFVVRVALNDRQQRFVQEYLKDCNATQAAIRAGYSKKTANEQASRLLANVSIRGAIDAAQAKLAEAAQVDARWVLDRLKIEAEFSGKGASHSARVSALKLLGDHHGIFREKSTLDQLLGCLPFELSEEIKRYLAASVQPNGDSTSASYEPG